MGDRVKLSDTNEPTELVPGDDHQLTAAATEARRMAAQLRAGADHVLNQRLHAWEGEAADRYRATASTSAHQIDSIAGALERVATALEQQAGVVQHGQRQATEAVAGYQKGVAKTKAWRAKVQELEADYRRQAAQAQAGNRAVPARAFTPGKDPGQQHWEPARNQVKDAQLAQARASTDVAQMVRQATGELPHIAAGARPSATTDSSRQQMPEHDPAADQARLRTLLDQMDETHVIGTPVPPSLEHRVQHVNPEGS